MATIKKHYQFTNFSHNEIIAELEKQRIKKNLSKKDFSQLAGYGRSTYSNWCSGNKGFSKKSFMAFANKYAPHLISEKTLFSTQNPLQATKPKPKPVVKPDPKTGKFVVEKPERDWSVPQAFPEGYVIPKGVKVLKIAKDDEYVKKGSVGTTIETSEAPFIKWENEDYSLCNQKEDWCQVSFLLAPLNPTDHPEHPDFGKVKLAANWEKDIPFEFEFIESKPKPEPFDIREVIAKYIRQHGTQLTAIELIGHLTIDAKWQSTEK